MFSFFRDDRIIGVRGVWWTVAVIAVVLTIKIFFIQHLMMHDDEAYYWYWSRYPMWIYPDHGPLLGFFSAFSVFILGDHPFSLRLMVILLFCLLSVLCYFWAVATYGEKNKHFAQRLGFLLGILIAVIPHYYGLVLIRTDSLMIFFIFLAIGLSHWAIFHCAAEKKSWFYIMSSFCWGLAFLAKLTTIFLFFGHIMFFFIMPNARRELKKWSVYLHFALPFLICLPMIYWDYLYDFPFVHNFLLRFQQPFSWDGFFQFHFLQWILYFPTYYTLFLFLICANGVMWLRKIFPLIFRHIARYRWANVFDGGGDNYVHWQEKIYFLLLSLPAIVYLLHKSFSMALFPNWTIFAAPGVTILLAIYLAENWIFTWCRTIFYASNTILALIILSFPILLSSKVSTFASDGTCLYSKYKFLLQDFPTVTPTVMQDYDNALFVGLDYKLPSMINLYVRPKRDAIALMHAPVQDKDVFSQQYSLWNMIVSRGDLTDKDFYFVGEVSVKNEQKSAKNLEYSLKKTYTSVEKLHDFTSYCREKKVARFYLYKVRGYRFFSTLLTPKKSLW